MTEHKPEATYTDLKTIATLPIGGATKYRGITKEVCDKYRVRESYDANGQVESRYYPYTSIEGNKIVAFKHRRIPKQFHAVGKLDAKSTKLFGQQAFQPGGKFVVITEGEEDALAAYQMLNSGDKNYVNPVVSLPNGISSIKAVQANLAWLETFETVIICPDMDEPGQAGVDKVAALFSPNKCKIMTLPRKDACECLKDGLEREFVSAFWNAKRFQPDGIVYGKDMWDMVSQQINVKSLPYPWAGLNEVTRGQRQGEMVLWVAGSGVAKSTFARYVAYSNLISDPTATIGMLFLEESARKTGLALMSLAAGSLLHLLDTPPKEEELRRAFELTLGTGRVYLYDSFGSNNVDNIVSRMRYMVKANNCTDIFLDHISIMVSDGGHGDERKALDEISTKFRSFCEEVQVRLHVVCHLKRPPGKGHEEGAETSLAQIRGSAGVGQLSDIVIGIERNGQHEDATIRNTSKIRVLKNRFSGDTGPACYLYYDKATGSITEVDEPEDYLDTPENKKPKDRPLNSFGGDEVPNHL